MEPIRDMKQFHDEVYRLELIRSSGAMLIKQDLRSLRVWFAAAGALVAAVLGFFVFRGIAKRGVRLDFKVRAVAA